MIRKTLSSILKLVHLGEEERFGSGWATSTSFFSLARLGVWALRGFFLKLFFKKSGGLVLIGRRVTLIGSGYLSVGRNFVMESGCELFCVSTQGISCGDNVTIGSYALIRPTSQFGGAVGEGLRIGTNSNIGPYCYIGCSGLIEIGSNVMISPRVSIYAENHNFGEITIPMKQQGVSRLTVKIEDDCWIAANSIILAGVTVGKGSVIAAGSVVTRDVVPYSVVGGNPAKIIKMRT